MVGRPHSISQVGLPPEVLLDFHILDLVFNLVVLEAFVNPEVLVDAFELFLVHLLHLALGHVVELHFVLLFLQQSEEGLVEGVHDLVFVEDLEFQDLLARQEQ